MANFFDQFDQQPPRTGGGNFFDQFDQRVDTTSPEAAEARGPEFKGAYDRYLQQMNDPEGAEFERAAQELAKRQEQFDGAPGASELFGNSFTLGLEDKAAGLAGGASAVVNSLTGTGPMQGKSFREGYNIARRAQEIREENARKNSGGRGTAAEIAGALGSGVLAKAPAAASAIARIFQAAREAGTLGVIQGLGDSQSDTVSGTLGDMAMGGAIGAGLGGSLGGLIETGRGVIQGARAAGRGAQSALDDEGGRAAGKVFQALADDGMTPEGAAARMAKRGTALVNVAGENTLGLGRAVSAKPGEGRTIINKALDAQQKASQGKVIDTVTDALGGGDKSYNTRIADMVESRSKTGSNIYGRAFGENFDNAAPGAEQALETLAPRVPAEALTNAMKIARAEGREFGQQLVASIDQVGNVTFSRAPSLQEWHYIQRGLRASTDSAYRAGFGEVGTAYKSLHRAVLKAMDAASPVYKTARKAYATQSQMIDALQRGREILNPNTTKNVDALVSELGDLSIAERDMVKIGLARQMQDMLEATPDTAGDMVKKIFGTKAKRDAVAAVFTDPKEFRAFEATMGRLAREGKAFRYVRTGSRTSILDSEKANAGALAEAAQVGMDVVTGHGGNTVVRGIMKLLRDMGGMDPGVAREVAKIMVEKNPQAALRALSKSSGRAANRQAIDDMLKTAGRLVRSGSIGLSSSTAGQAVQVR